ncbi:MAG: DUF58 domain-containing protein [Candidatus Altiarchaeota archaeon]|nr:DUF58 domain-containing protein [Candidatus Altiarchaeota archaeon]
MEKRYIDELMNEIDANVGELLDIFKFLLKYNVLFRGSGIEFSGLRDYIQGEDDATKIDWKSSLRANKLYVKQYEDEQNLDIYILVNASSSMLFGTQGKLKSEYSATVAGSLAYAAIESSDNVGFGLFSDSMKVSLPPVGDITQYFMILKHLVDPRFYGGTCDFEAALSYILNSINDKTALFIISDFIGLQTGWTDTFKAVCSKLDSVFGVMVRDIADSTLPEGVGNIRLSDPFIGDKALLVNMDRIRKDYEREAMLQESAIQKEFTNSGAGFIKVYTHESFTEPIVKYIQMI